MRWRWELIWLFLSILALIRGREPMETMHLLYLEPVAGSKNGGTSVTVKGMGWEKGASLYVHMDNIDGQYFILKPLSVENNNLVFLTPSNLSDHGALITVTKQDRYINTFQEKSLFFKIYSEPTKVTIFPQNIKLSGGTLVYLFLENAVAVEKVTIRFASNSSKKDVEGRFDMVYPPEELQGLEQRLWTVIVVDSPFWQEKETVKVFYSFNDQNYHTCLECEVFFQDESSLFGGVAHVKERVDVSERIGEMAAVVELPPVNSGKSATAEGMGGEGIREGGGWMGTIGGKRDGKGEEEKRGEERSNEGGEGGKGSGIGEGDAHAVTQSSLTVTILPSVSHEGEGGSGSTPEDGYRKAGSNDKAKKYDASNVVLLDKFDNQYVLSRPKFASSIHEDHRLVENLIFLLGTAAVLAFLFSRLGLPPVLGFLCSGLVLGYFGNVSNPIGVASIGQIGVTLLLFSLGLEFSMEKIISVRSETIYGGLISLLIFEAVFIASSIAMKSNVYEGMLVGILLSMSSTALCVGSMKSEKPPAELKDQGDPTLATQDNNVTIGILVIQDVLLCLFSAFFPVLASFSGEKKTTVKEILLTSLTPVLHLIVLLLLTFVLYRYVVRRLTNYLLSRCARELWSLLFVCYGVSYGFLSHEMGLSMELGAFLAGLTLTTNDKHQLHMIEDTLVSTIELLGAIFFISAGLQIDPLFLLDNMTSILLVWASLCAFKFLVLIGVLCLGSKVPFERALKISYRLAHVGEFAFVIIGKGYGLAILNRQVYLLLLGTTALSLLLTPVILRLMPFFTNCFSRLSRVYHWQGRGSRSYSALAMDIDLENVSYSGESTLYEGGTVVRRTIFPSDPEVLSSSSRSQ